LPNIRGRLKRYIDEEIGQLSREEIAAVSGQQEKRKLILKNNNAISLESI